MIAGAIAFVLGTISMGLHGKGFKLVHEMDPALYEIDKDKSKADTGFMTGGPFVLTEAGYKQQWADGVSYRNLGILGTELPIGVMGGVALALAGLAAILDALGFFKGTSVLVHTVFWVALIINLTAFGFGAQAFHKCSDGIVRQNSGIAPAAWFLKAHPLSSPPTADEMYNLRLATQEMSWPMGCARSCSYYTKEDVKPDGPADREACGKGSWANAILAFAILVVLFNVVIVVFTSCMPAKKSGAVAAQEPKPPVP